MLSIVLLHSALESFPGDALYTLYRPCQTSATRSSSSPDLVALGDPLDYSSKQKTQLDVAYLQDMVLRLLVVVGHAIIKWRHPCRRRPPPELVAPLPASATLSQCLPRPREALHQYFQLLPGPWSSTSSSSTMSSPAVSSPTSRIICFIGEHSRHHSNFSYRSFQTVQNLPLSLYLNEVVSVHLFNQSKVLSNLDLSNVFSYRVLICHPSITI